MAKNTHEMLYVVVKGEGLFPVDALRVWCACPFRPSDSLAILAPGERTIALKMFRDNEDRSEQRVIAWEREGWRILIETPSWAEVARVLEEET